MKNLLLLGLILILASCSHDNSKDIALAQMQSKEDLKQQKIDSIQQLIDRHKVFIKKNREIFDKGWALQDSLVKAGQSQAALRVLDQLPAEHIDKLVGEVKEWKQQIDMIELQ
jgi:thioredoxin-like negative regulator of GroEL